MYIRYFNKMYVYMYIFFTVASNYFWNGDFYVDCTTHLCGDHDIPFLNHQYNGKNSLFFFFVDCLEGLA